ncbi:MAG TPA: hypothetical protein VEX37_06030 [Thermomicrobiales bacterium]|jgi:hypothetical protein|nr:hypothetical protein [Thermomicrobiales bacterium]
MGEHMFDDFTRRAGEAVSRRASLLTLSTAGLAALVQPIEAAAKKSKNDKKTKKATQACKNELAECTTQATQCSAQADQCTTFVSAVCTGDPGCAAIAACCAFLGSCDVGAFFVCLDGAGAS